MIGSACIFTYLEIGQGGMRCCRPSKNFCTVGLIVCIRNQIPSRFVNDMSVGVTQGIMTSGCNINLVPSSCRTDLSEVEHIINSIKSYRWLRSEVRGFVNRLIT